MSKKSWLFLIGRARRVACIGAYHARDQAGDGRLLLQGRLRRAAWLRGFAHGEDPGADPGRRDRGEADAEGGLDVDVVEGKYANAYDYHGNKLTSGVKEVAWSGGKLPDHNYDEFVVSSFLTDSLKPNTTLYFPVVQECETGVSRWIEIPADGAGHSHEGKSPAPGVKLLPKP